ncbi:hypothetical protein LTR17_024039 [Elasticomyces elasticus]|nr:hypothetical protein LTR17_024039 [Elasticomyces elasticus]
MKSQKRKRQRDLAETSAVVWGFQVGVDMMTVPGHVLNNPMVEYRGGEQKGTGKGVWNLGESQFYGRGQYDECKVVGVNHLLAVA